MMIYAKFQIINWHTHMHIFNDRGDMVLPDLFDFNRQIDYTNESWLENVLSCNLSTLRYDTDH